MTLVRDATVGKRSRRGALRRTYKLNDQVGFVLRKVSQRHTGLFAGIIGEDITPMQWAVLAKLAERGPLSQNRLGRETAMDAATVKGVVDRLTKRGILSSAADPEDQRLLIVSLTSTGWALVQRLVPKAHAITEATLAPLDAPERRQLISLLAKLC